MHDNHTHQQPIHSSHQTRLAAPTEPSRHSISRIPLSIVTAMTAIALLAGSATAWFTWQTITARRAAETSTPVETTVPAQPEPTAPTAQVPQSTEPQPSVETAPTQAETTVEVFWVKDSGTHLEMAATPITLQVEDPEQPQGVLEAAFAQLLQGTESDTVASTIPETTQLRNIEIQADGIHVDLSQEFTTGGGSASMIGRLGQVVYTASTLDPDAAVWISIEGEPLELLGGEGVMVSQPMTRTEFHREFSL